MAELNEWLWQVSGRCGLGCSQCSTEAAWQRFVCLTELAPLFHTGSQWPATGALETPARFSPHLSTFPLLRQRLPDSIGHARTFLCYINVGFFVEFDSFGASCCI